MILLLLGALGSLGATENSSSPRPSSPLNRRIGECEPYVAALAHPKEADRIRGWKYLISEVPDQALKAIDVGVLDAVVVDQTNISTFTTAVIHRQPRIVEKYLSSSYLYALGQREAHWVGKNASHRQMRAEIINAQDLEGNSSLHYAVLSGDEQIIKMLLDHGGDRDRKNRLGQSARDLARGKSFEYLFLNEGPVQSH